MPSVNLERVPSSDAPESLDVSEACTVKTDQSTLRSITSIGDNSEIFEEGPQIKGANHDGVRQTKNKFSRFVANFCIWWYSSIY